MTATPSTLASPAQADFCTNNCNIYFKNNKVGSYFLINDFFQLYIDIFVNYVEQNVNAIGSKHPKDNVNKKYLWYLGLGHIGEDRINRLEKTK